jgi:hypothetical protein
MQKKGHDLIIFCKTTRETMKSYAHHFVHSFFAIPLPVNEKSVTHTHTHTHTHLLLARNIQKIVITKYITRFFWRVILILKNNPYILITKKLNKR